MITIAPCSCSPDVGKLPTCLNLSDKLKTAQALREAYAYSDLTLQRLKKDFGLQVDEQRDLFAVVEPIAGSDLLNDTL